jgi:D-aminoacyl-tRNA deacylase
VRVVFQRVSRADVRVAGRSVGAIGRGALLLVGFTVSDDAGQISWMTEKVVSLRVFSDRDGRMNLGLGDVGGSLLVVSQFTLYGDARKGRRPSFIDAAPPERANGLYEEFVASLRAAGVHVATGVFGAEMEVELVNDGPVTMILER